MTVCMLGADVETPGKEQQPGKFYEYFKTIVDKGPEYLDVIFNQDPMADSTAYNNAKREYAEQGFFQRNQTLLIGLAIIGGVTVLATMTGKRRRRR